MLENLSHIEFNNAYYRIAKAIDNVIKNNINYKHVITACAKGDLDRLKIFFSKLPDNQLKKYFLALGNDKKTLLDYALTAEFPSLEVCKFLISKCPKEQIESLFKINSNLIENFVNLVEKGGFSDRSVKDFLVILINCDADQKFLHRLYSLISPRNLIQIFPESKIEETPFSSQVFSNSLTEQSYATLTARLKPAEKIALEETLKNLPETGKKIDEILRIINGNDEELLKIKEKDFDLYAMLALKEGKIDLSQFCTLSLIKAAFSEPKFESIRKISLIKNQEEASKILFESESFKKINGLKYSDDCEREKVNNFINEIAASNIPDSEKNFFVISCGESECSEMKQTFHRIGFKIFQRIDPNNINSNKIIPSFSMMQAYLNKNLKFPMQLNPVISLSELNDIRSTQLDDKRDMAFPFSMFPLPDEADNRSTTELDFNAHDFYHCWIASHVPKLHRRHLLQMSSLYTNFKDSQIPFVAQFSDTFEHVFTDLECIYYKRNPNDCTNFFATIERNFMNVFSSAINDITKKDPNFILQPEVLSSLINVMDLYLLKNMKDFESNNIHMKDIYKNKYLDIIQSVFSKFSINKNLIPMNTLKDQLLYVHATD